MKKLLKVAKKVVLYFFAFSVFGVLFYAIIPVPFTPLMMIRAIEKIGTGEMPTFNRDWEPISNISPNMQLAVIGAEDQKFYEHFGFDTEAIQKAFKNNKKGRRIKGGSTITQQTAKNVFLWPGRSYIRKGFEAYFSFLIEILWSKKRILSVYLNNIEMGDGIYGAQAAARYYFHKDAEHLSKSEAAAIAAVLPNPRKWRPDNPSSYIQKRRNKIVRQINNLQGAIPVY